MICPYCYSDKCKIPIRRTDRMNALKLLALSAPGTLSESFRETVIRVSLAKGKTDCFLRSTLYHSQPYVIYTLREQVEKKLELLIDAAEDFEVNESNLSTLLSMLGLHSVHLMKKVEVKNDSL